MQKFVSIVDHEKMLQGNKKENADKVIAVHFTAKKSPSVPPRTNRLKFVGIPPFEKIK